MKVSNNDSNFKWYMMVVFKSFMDMSWTEVCSHVAANQWVVTAETSSSPTCCAAYWMLQHVLRWKLIAFRTSYSSEQTETVRSLRWSANIKQGCSCRNWIWELKESPKGSIQLSEITWGCYKTCHDYCQATRRWRVTLPSGVNTNCTQYFQTFFKKFQ